jgi:cytochrome c peroxidase
VPVEEPSVPADAAVATSRIQQRDRQFTPAHVRIAAGGTLTVVNDDTRTHNLRLADPRLSFDSGAQAPGQSVAVPFATAGRYQVFCGIHPTMTLTVEVDQAVPPPP